MGTNPTPIRNPLSFLLKLAPTLSDKGRGSLQTISVVLGNPSEYFRNQMLAKMPVIPNVCNPTAWCNSCCSKRCFITTINISSLESISPKDP